MQNEKSSWRNAGDLERYASYRSMNYHLTGILSSFFVILSLAGIALQLSLVWRRKREYSDGRLTDERPTSILSLNRFSTSFFAFFTMFLYGLTLEVFNHYLVWPRTLALGLLLGILFEIQQDRRDKLSRIVFFCSSFLVLLSVALAFTEYRIVVNSVGVSHALIIFAMCLYAQGAIHQIAKIRRSGRTGALSLSMHQLFFLKDLSSLTFGFAMGFRHGWPVIALHGLSLFVQMITMWHFRWSRMSIKAESRRVEYDAVVKA